MSKTGATNQENHIEDLESLRRYTESLTNFLPVAFCIVNSLDLILDANRFFEKVAGYDPTEVVGMEIRDLFLEKEEIASLTNELREIRDQVEKELSLITKNEKIVPVKISVISRKKEGDFVGYLMTITDVSDKRELRREMQDELEEKTEQLEKKANQMEDSRSALLNILEDVDQSFKEAEKERIKTAAIIENFIDGMLFFSADNYLNIVNPKMEEFFDVKSRDVTGRDLEDLTSFPTLEPLIDFITNKEGDEITDLFREELKVSESFYLEVTTTRISKDDEDLGTLVHVHDITREKRIERIKSEFVSVAAHQLRTPLSGIKWTLETFKEEVIEEKEKLTEEEQTLLQKAYDANERMVRLVNDLLNVSRIEEGRYVYEPEKIDIYEALEPVIKDYKETIKEKENIDFKVNKIKRSLPSVKIDAEKIHIVLQNFLDNAIKYTDEGEIVLTIDSPNSDTIKISVQDDGIGIPEEQQERLFNKFFRAENVQRKDVEGSGLGLFISKNIVEAHGGEIGFDSTEGEGSIFYFTLPVEKEDEENFIRDF